MERIKELKEMKEKLMALGATEEDVKKLFEVALEVTDKIVKES